MRSAVAALLRMLRLKYDVIRDSFRGRQLNIIVFNRNLMYIYNYIYEKQAVDNNSLS